MAELADALDLGSSGESRAGSTPVIRTVFYQGLSFTETDLFSFLNLYK